MHQLLQKLLAKRGVESVNDLQGEEKEVYQRWRSILSGEKVTVEKIEEFCKSQIGVIEARFRKFDTPWETTDRLVVAHTVYKTLLEMIAAPEKERANLEEFLTKQLHE